MTTTICVDGGMRCAFPPYDPFVFFVDHYDCFRSNTQPQRLDRSSRAARSRV